MLVPGMIRTKYWPFSLKTFWTLAVGQSSAWPKAPALKMSNKDPMSFLIGSLVRLARSAARHRESVAVSSPTSFGNCSSAFAFSDMKKSKPRGDHADSMSLAATTSCPVHKLTSIASTSSDFQLSSSKRASSMRVRARISLRRPLVLSIFSNMLGSKPIFQQANQFFVRHQNIRSGVVIQSQERPGSIRFRRHERRCLIGYQRKYVGQDLRIIEIV